MPQPIVHPPFESDLHKIAPPCCPTLFWVWSKIAPPYRPSLYWVWNKFASPYRPFIYWVRSKIAPTFFSLPLLPHPIVHPFIESDLKMPHPTLHPLIIRSNQQFLPAGNYYRIVYSVHSNSVQWTRGYLEVSNKMACRFYWYQAYLKNCRTVLLYNLRNDRF